MKQFIENNTRFRFYYNGCIAISEDGLTARQLKFGEYSRKWSAGKKDLKLKKDLLGRTYVVSTKWDKNFKVIISEAVAACFCPPRPSSDTPNAYELVHLDGDLDNNNYKNLSWQERHQYHSAKSSEVVDYKGHLITVNNDVTFYDNDEKKPLDICDSMGDADMDLMCCIEPHLCLHAAYGAHCLDRPHIDELMAEAGYVQGDFHGMKNPEILHIDNDWKNFNPDNLKWIEGDSAEYDAYRKQKIDDMNARLKELNPIRGVPDFYLQKYGPYKGKFSFSYPWGSMR
ncbi:MAG: hypothetical protein MJZ83_04650 [Bacteroidaceae bacterium]|nr:hypothetical protein [Bacteroidaceae bacterium]